MLLAEGFDQSIFEAFGGSVERFMGDQLADPDGINLFLGGLGSAAGQSKCDHQGREQGG